MRSSRLIGQRNRVLGLRYLSSTQPSRPPGLESDLREHGSHVEVLVIGSGIGGASSALGATTPQLAEPQSKKQLQTGGLVTSLDATGPKKRVLVLESEEDFNYHSTGKYLKFRFSPRQFVCYPELTLIDFHLPMLSLRSTSIA